MPSSTSISTSPSLVLTSTPTLSSDVSSLFPDHSGFPQPSMPSPADPSPFPNVVTSPSLYLYTFLATLVLLLTVSSTIIIRSLVLRRRHRRMIAEAIANGTWPPPYAGRRGRRGRGKNYGEKPKVFEAVVPGFKAVGDHWVDPENDLKGKDAKEGWRALMPISSSYVSPPSATGIAPSSKTPSPPPSTLSSHLLAFSQFMTAGFLSRSSTSLSRTPSSISPSPTLPISPPPIPTSTLDTLSATDSKLRITILIAMPCPPGAKAGENDEEEVPHLEFGVAEVGTETLI